MFQPVIKWSGSKRSQCENIIKYFPKEIDTYYEPFCGGASVCRALMESKDHNVNKFVCSDLNRDLINLWNAVKNRPKEVADYYKILWTEMNKNDDKAIKRAYFENVRERYNKEWNPLDFMFIMRTTTNGMPRYNSKGEFNNSFHITRNGINPDTLEKIIFEWSDLIRIMLNLDIALILKLSRKRMILSIWTRHMQIQKECILTNLTIKSFLFG